MAWNQSLRPASADLRKDPLHAFADCGGDFENERFFLDGPVVRGGLGDAEDTAEIVSDENRNGEAPFHSSLPGARSSLAAGVGLKIAQGDWFAPFGREAGDAFADGHGVDDRQKLWGDSNVGDEAKHAIVEKVDGTRLAIEVSESGSKGSRGGFGRGKDGGNGVGKHGEAVNKN
jgi:hypothetical protein